MTASDRMRCEVLVVGTGAGGATVAATLAAAGVDVLMLDEGPHVVAAEAPRTLAQSMLTMWRNGGLATTLGSQVAFAEGRCVGGGTEINSAIFQRAAPAVLDGWAAANRVPALRAEALAPYYDRVGAAVRVSSTPGPLGPPSDILGRAAAAMGWSSVDLERATHRCVGTNRCALGCPTGAKQSMTATFVPRALADGARLIDRCRIERLVSRGARVTGAVAVSQAPDGSRRRIQIEAEHVFVCAGTTQTPRLLAASGLGRRRAWTFQLHPTIRVIARFDEEVDGAAHRLPLTAITEFMPDLRFGGSVFTLPTFGTALAEDWALRGERLAEHRNSLIYYAMIRPDGVGRLWTAPGLPEPISTYALTARDVRRLDDGLRKLSQALLAVGARSLTPSIAGHPGWSTADQVRAAPALDQKRASLMTIHLFSSCPMGEDADIFPVDAEGRLRGVDNVTIGDASVLPSAPGVNPQATIMALALRTAESFLSRR